MQLRVYKGSNSLEKLIAEAEYPIRRAPHFTTIQGYHYSSEALIYSFAEGGAEKYFDRALTLPWILLRE